MGMDGGKTNSLSIRESRCATKAMKKSQGGGRSVGFPRDLDVLSAGLYIYFRKGIKGDLC